MMSDGADIPFHTAGTPRIADRQISRLDHRVVCDKVPSGMFIQETDQFPAQIGEKSRLEVIVFQHCRFPDTGLQIGIVLILQLGGHGAGAGAEADVESGFIRKFILQCSAAIGFHGRHGRLSGKICTQKNFIFKTQFSHDRTPSVE